MKQGTYFRIPERPADLERLWSDAEPLRAAALPDWLTVEDTGDYRYVGSASMPDPTSRQYDSYYTEMEELEAAGLVVDEDPRDRWLRHFYIKRPARDPVWSIGIYAGPSPVRLAPWPDLKNPVLTHEDVTDVPATFIADPFMVRDGNTWYMFFEVMNWRRNLGEIGLAVSPDGLHWKYQQIVLSEAFHLSYPYVFRWKDDYYMIPESYQAGAVRLYKARKFPEQWAHAATLLEGPYLVDTSVFQHAGQWWLFTDTSAGMQHDTLRLYHAPELKGRWTEHPSSPLVQGDPCIARPAGRVITADDKVIRFAQSGQPYYGSTVRAFEVTELTPTSYKEKEVKPSPILGPTGAGWNACGMHQVDAHRLDDGRWIASVDGWLHEEILQVLKAEGGCPAAPA
jgi:hypothetical protein